MWLFLFRKFKFDFGPIGRDRAETFYKDLVNFVCSHQTSLLSWQLGTLYRVQTAILHESLTELLQPTWTKMFSQFRCFFSCPSSSIPTLLTDDTDYILIALDLEPSRPNQSIPDQRTWPTQPTQPTQPPTIISFRIQTFKIYCFVQFNPPS